MGKELLYTAIDSDKKVDIKDRLMQLGARPNTSFDKDEFYVSYAKKYGDKWNEEIRKELEEMLINDPNSFYHIHGYDFTKKLSVERELLEKEILK